MTFTATTASEPKDTKAMLNEALAIIKALAPKEAPDGIFAIKGLTGLKIIKNDMIPENTIMVSKRLFDLIYEASTNVDV